MGEGPRCNSMLPCRSRPRAGRFAVLGICLFAILIVLTANFVNVIGPLLLGAPPNSPLSVCPSTRQEMLIQFSEELELRGIPYSLMYGSLLGAVRDGNIIPWTPDIDIYIPDIGGTYRPKEHARFFGKPFPCTASGNNFVSCNYYHSKTLLVPGSRMIVLVSVLLTTPSSHP